MLTNTSVHTRYHTHTGCSFLLQADGTDCTTAPIGPFLLSALVEDHQLSQGHREPGGGKKAQQTYSMPTWFFWQRWPRMALHKEEELQCHPEHPTRGGQANLATRSTSEPHSFLLHTQQICSADMSLDPIPLYSMVFCNITALSASSHFPSAPKITI